MTTETLRLRAESAEDFEALSALLQDAIVPLLDLRWLPDEKRFLGVFNRYRWERGDERPGERVLSALSIGEVRAVKRRGLDGAPGERLLNLLSIRLSEVDGASAIDLAFSGGADIRVLADRPILLLSDLDEPYPTRFRPDHPDGATP